MSRLSRTVLVLGVVSLLTDIASEMIYPLLPVFLSGTLGATALELGLIEGLAETTASLLKVVSGLWTDRVRRRKPFVLAGYTIAALTRPLIGIASSWQFVLGLRFADRVGKGIRTSPRDALIADTTDEQSRGRAYGFHRSMDHAGAVIGPLLASALLIGLGISIRTLFLLAAIPGLLALVLIAVGVREPKAPLASGQGASAFNPLRDWRALTPDFKRLLLSYFVFTLGNSTDAFLLMRLSDAGISAGWIATLWSLHHGVKMVSTYFFGVVSDRFPRRILIVAGWVYFALVYFAFARFTSPTVLISVFLAYGVYYGLSEPAERALVADLAPASLRGSAFGYFHCAVGLGALPASLLFGLLWKHHGAQAAFLTGAALALAGSVLLGVGVRERKLTSPL